MDYLWTPWRYRYIASVKKSDPCVFCDAAAAKDDRDTLILLRGDKNFVILNRYPYTSGHLMVVPYAHVADLASADAEALAEMMRLAQRLQTALQNTYRPEGFNIGMNLGRAAGAGIVGHLHLHVLPRWAGDANFMTVVGETRVEPEELGTTYDRLLAALSGAG
jgi:ATP adenylyltransferase